MMDQIKNSDTLLVGFDHGHGDISVLIMGRKGPGETVEIINQFQGKEAEEIYKKLTTKANTRESVTLTTTVSSNP